MTYTAPRNSGNTLTIRVYKSIPMTFIVPCSSGNTLTIRVYKSIPMWQVATLGLGIFYIIFSLSRNKDNKTVRH